MPSEVVMICCGKTGHESPFENESVTFPGHVAS